MPVETTHFLAQRVQVLPSPNALEVAQDRLKEKALFQQLEIPTTEFMAVNGAESLAAAVKKTGLPAILKTCRMGYDGKGQRILRTAEDVAQAEKEISLHGSAKKHGDAPYVLESYVPFSRELSILAVRASTGETAFYPLVENHHRDGILRLSLAPAPQLKPDVQHAAESAALSVLEALDYVGVLAIEFFEHNGGLLANEMAPRVHNSGHWTFEGAMTSQFENHLRAVLGWPLGSTHTIGCSAMLNLIGEEPEAAQVLAVRDAHCHLYGKSARAGTEA